MRIPSDGVSTINHLSKALTLFVESYLFCSASALHSQNIILPDIFSRAACQCRIEAKEKCSAHLSICMVLIPHCWYQGRFSYWVVAGLVKAVPSLRRHYSIPTFTLRTYSRSSLTHVKIPSRCLHVPGFLQLCWNLRARHLRRHHPG